MVVTWGLVLGMISEKVSESFKGDKWQTLDRFLVG